MTKDDQSLLAMRAARMSVGSIAFTMGWSDARVVRRLEALDAAARPTVTPDDGDGADDGAPDGLGEEDLVTPPPLRDGQGFVTRAVRLIDGAMAASVLLADGRLVLAQTGGARLKPSAIVAVGRVLTWAWIAWDPKGQAGDRIDRNDGRAAG